MDDFYEFFFSYLNIPLLYLIVSFFVCVIFVDVCVMCLCRRILREKNKDNLFLQPNLTK